MDGDSELGALASKALDALALHDLNINHFLSKVSEIGRTRAAAAHEMGGR
jgi:hypothetical protein